MVIDSTTALVATTPVPWPSNWSAHHEADSSRDEQRRGNGIVYVGVEANRTRRIYSASGAPAEGTMALGQLIDIYV